MGVFKKQGAWWIDWREGKRRRRKKTHARNKTEAKKLLAQIRGKVLPRDLGLYDHCPASVGIGQPTRPARELLSCGHRLCLAS